MDFVISDTHFGHKNIIGYEQRPFPNVDAMDKFMIEAWNAVVRSGDRVFFLGDFSFHNKGNTQKILSLLNGYKIMIMGNHDITRSKTWWREVGFDEVSEFPIIYNKFFILSHEPVYISKAMPYINIHGHIHDNHYGEESHINVSVEILNYIPEKIDNIIQLFKTEV